MSFVFRLLKPRLLLKITIITIAICYFFGIFTMTLEKNYKELNDYIASDITKYVKQLQHKQPPDITPIHFYNYVFITVKKKKCYLG